MVLLDPAKSADPPIKVLFSLVSAFKTNSEDFRVAKLLFSFNEICFSIFKDLEKLFFNILSIVNFFFYRVYSNLIPT